MSNIECKVVEISPLTEHVAKVLLKPTEPVVFIAGQYIELVISENDKRPFSIANSPLDNEYIELHIGAAMSDEWTSAALNHIKNNSVVYLKGPSGNAGLRDNDNRPIILLAGGTGFSYTKSIADTLLKQNHQQQIYFYWGLRNTTAAYQLEYWLEKHNELDNFHFIPVIETANADWQGRSGLVINAVLEDFENLADYHIYCAGRFEMVGKARDEFVKKGLNVDHIFADAFAFI
ncbi:NAD(P)H-flavin reductase [Catenovulum sp. 2E275]|uniref:NAD(P)H-flavin reductase n=1 Tax=Catenovulum sp. 2E275 TaxID=2980497 RepID=UPI0021CF0E48|nr:NAD(P)H-flavin reductase [Catenovulum sp. 2E275]MCU4675825.1 NAD(P)H-flavin reductase [Catenovulum sp. 2E275]